jgi:hypothetical protein
LRNGWVSSAWSMSEEDGELDEEFDDEDFESEDEEDEDE